MLWLDLKTWLVSVTSLERDALHIYAALGAQLLLAAALRRRVDSFLPLGIVMVLELVNEWADLTYEIWPNRIDQWMASVHDVLNTAAVPLVLILVVRAVRRRDAGRAERGTAAP